MDGTNDVQNSQFQKGQALFSALTNVAVVVGFAAFVYTVRYVLMSIA